MDEDAPQIWKEIKKASFSEDTISSLNDTDRECVLAWEEKRRHSIQDRLKQAIEAEIECETCLIRESVPFVRARVHSLHFSGNKNEEALLTIWQPTDEQLSLLQDGHAVQIENVFVRDSKYAGMLQLTCNNRTVVHPCEIPHSVHNRLSHFRRRDLSLYDIHLRSHKMTCETQGLKFEFDTTAIVLLHRKFGDKTVAYVVDEFNVLLRIEDQNQRLPRQLIVCRTSKEFEVLRFSDLSLLSFDTDENCAVAYFQDHSQVHNTAHARSEELRCWARTGDGSNRLHRLSHYLQADISPWQSSSLMTAFGYIVGLREKSHNLYVVEVDCGTEESQEWEVSALLLEKALPIARENESAIFMKKEERCVPRGPFAGLLCARGLLWYFNLQKISQKSDSGCKYKVNIIEAASAGSLCPLFIQ